MFADAACRSVLSCMAFTIQERKCNIICAVRHSSVPGWWEAGFKASCLGAKPLCVHSQDFVQSAHSRAAEASEKGSLSTRAQVMLIKLQLPLLVCYVKNDLVQCRVSRPWRCRVSAASMSRPSSNMVCKMHYSRSDNLSVSASLSAGATGSGAGYQEQPPAQPGHRRPAHNFLGAFSRRPQVAQGVRHG